MYIVIFALTPPRVVGVVRTFFFEEASYTWVSATSKLYMKRLTIERIKLDRSSINQMNGNYGDASVIIFGEESLK